MLDELVTFTQPLGSLRVGTNANDRASRSDTAPDHLQSLVCELSLAGDHEAVGTELGGDYGYEHTAEETGVL